RPGRAQLRHRAHQRAEPGTRVARRAALKTRRREAGIQTLLLSTSGHRRRMSTYTAPLQDIRFALHDVLAAEALFARLGHTEATRDIVDAVLEESARFTETVLAPRNRGGDEGGCSYDKATGGVSTPPGVKAGCARRGP